MREEVFISYARFDWEKVMPVVHILRSTDISVWVDEAKVDDATLWSEEIVDAINNCKDMVVMLTELHRFRQYRQGGDAGFWEQKEERSSSPWAYWDPPQTWRQDGCRIESWREMNSNHNQFC